MRSELAGGVAQDLSTFLDWYASYAIREVGLWRIAKPVAMNRKPRRGTTPQLDAAALASATGTLYVGKDGSGARFFVERHPERSEVFIHDPGAGQLALLADSLRTFLEMNELIVRWDRLCETHDIDPDPDAVEDIDASTPGFAELRAQARALKGRVNLASRSDFDETIEALAKSTLRAKSKSNVLAAYKKAKHAHL